MTGYVVLQALYAIAIVALSWVLSGWIAGPTRAEEEEIVEEEPALEEAAPVGELAEEEV